MDLGYSVVVLRLCSFYVHKDIVDIMWNQARRCRIERGLQIESGKLQTINWLIKARKMTGWQNLEN